MANVKYIIAASITAAALFSTPLVISSSIDKEIESNRVTLEKNGLKHGSTQILIDKDGLCVL